MPIKKVNCLLKYTILISLLQFYIWKQFNNLNASYQSFIVQDYVGPVISNSTCIVRNVSTYASNEL